MWNWKNTNFSHQRATCKQHGVNIQLTFSSCREIFASGSSYLLSGVWLLKPFHLLWVTDVAALSSLGICPAYWAVPCVCLQRDRDKSRTKCQYPVAELMSIGFAKLKSYTYSSANVLRNPFTNNVCMYVCTHYIHTHTHISVRGMFGGHMTEMTEVQADSF